MGSRPLRLHYDHDLSLEVDDELGSVVEPWIQHRRRFLDSITALDDAQLSSATRCSQWTGRDVLSHLVVVDGFFVASLLGGRSGEPTRFLPGFDPTDTPEQLVVPMRDQSTGEIVEKFAIGTQTFVQTVEGFDENDWKATAESPMGHVTTRLVLAHALWDSWLHERDILVPLGETPPIDDDELYVSTWYGLFVGCVQGGLLGDPAPVGPGADASIDAVLTFEDLPDRPLRVQVDEGVRLSRADTADARSADATVNALGLVETFTGRGGDADVGDRLPADLAAQLDRGREIL